LRAAPLSTMCCPGCNPTTAFSWVGGVLVNASFVALISWGTASFWPIGLALAIIYSALLFLGAVCLRRRSNAKQLALVIDILLVLGIVGVAASGSILSYNVLGCGAPRPVGPSGSEISWTFPQGAAQGSTEVAAWAALPMYESGQRASFVFAPSTASVFFGGNVNRTFGSRLWVASGSSQPIPLAAELRNPNDLVSTLNHVCFTAYLTASDTGSAVYCYAADGSSYTTVSVSSAINGRCCSNPQGLLVIGGDKLYWKDQAPFGSSPSEGVVYRAEPPFTSATLLSVPTSAAFPPPAPPASPGSGNSGGDGCDSEEGFRRMAIAILFLATLPALVSSVVLWWRLGSPAMSFTTFGAVSGLTINIYAIIDPDGSEAYDLIKWWFLAFGAAWLIAFAFLKLTNRVSTSTIAWAVNVGCLAYFAAAHALTEVPITDVPWRWVVYQFISIIPMLVLAIVVSSTAAALPLVLASAGIFIDAYKIMTEITELVEDETAKIFIRFLTLGAVGVGVVFAGIAYNRYQQSISDAVEFVATRACGPCRKPKVEPKGEGGSVNGAPVTASL